MREKTGKGAGKPSGQRTFEQFAKEHDAILEERAMEALKRKEAKEQGKYAPSEELPGWYQDLLKKRQQATYLNARDTKDAEKLFDSTDKAKEFKSLVREGAPAKMLFASAPRPVNPRNRSAAVRDYLFWMNLRKHSEFQKRYPEFENRLRYAVSDINGFRARMSPEGREKFDGELKGLLEQKGHHPAQFEIHFPQVAGQRPAFEQSQGSAAKNKRRGPGYDKRPGE